MKRKMAFCYGLLVFGCSAVTERVSELQVHVVTSEARRAQIHRTIRVPATLFPIEEARLSSRLTASIRHLAVRKGDRVVKGQTLVILDDRDHQAQRDEASASLADAEASLVKLREGTLPVDIEQAEGRLKSAKAVLDQAEAIFRRRSELFKEGALPERQLILSKTELQQAKVNFELAKKSLDLLVRRTRQQDLRMAALRRDQQKARLALLETQLGYTRIESPFSGSITDQFVYPGDMAQPGTPLVTVTNLSRVVARAQVPESISGDLSLRQQCSFVPMAARGVSLSGQVSVVNRAVNPASRTVEAWCEISDPGESVRAGSYGEAAFLLGVEQVLLVPKSAVQLKEGSNQGIALVVDRTDTAHRREVETGEAFGEEIEIRKGLTVGETVIIEGGYGLPEGTRVVLTEGGAS